MQKVLILDFGSQFTQLITRRIRELNIYSEIHPFTYPLQKIQNDSEIKAIILSGGPNSIYEENSPQIDPEILNLGIPVLGICYGMQLLANTLGGKVEGSQIREYGKTDLEIVDTKTLFKEFSNHNIVWMSHGDKVTKLPPNFEIIAKTPTCPIAGFANNDKKLFGIQFHPEVYHTQNGTKILENFLLNIAKIKPNWTSHNFIENEIVKVQNQVGNHKVLCGLSGGVDSSVVAALLNTAIKNQLHCVFVDHGLLRANERIEVENTFRKNFKVKLTVVDSEKLFLERLKDIRDPEQKRKIIGNTFIEVFLGSIKKIEENDELEFLEIEEKDLVGDFKPQKFKFLAQGTLYPDVVESVSFSGGPSHTIKSHHNVGGLPEKMELKLVEPLRELFKDEVRKIGRELGLPSEIVDRHPFPGPGLGIRVIGDVTKEKLEVLRQADKIFIEELKTNWQDFNPTSNHFDLFYFKERGLDEMQNLELRISSHCLIFNPNLNKFLVIDNPDLDYYYNVGGGQDEGESLLQCLFREIKEESSLESNNLKNLEYFGKVQSIFKIESEDRQIFSHTFYAETEIENVISKNPKEKLIWATSEEIIEKNGLDSTTANILLNLEKLRNESRKIKTLYQQTWQAFAVLTEVKSVGVMGDGRTYENLVGLRAVTATDGMTADWARLPYDFLAKVSNKIINEVKGVNRVAYDISSKPPATIEWE